MAATQSPAPSSSSSSSSFASRRPLARAALPPFTLPPPPEFPRPTAGSASSSTAGTALSPPTPTQQQQQPPSSGSPYSTTSSPGYASRASSASVSMLAHPQRASSHSPYDPRSRPSPLSHPLNGGPGISTAPIQLSPRKPLPGSSGSQSRTSPPSRFTEKLPSIASLIPPPSTYGAPPPGSPNQGSATGLPAPGYLAMPPVKGPWGLGPPPASNPRYYHEFSVPEYPIARETSQQDRPFRCDLCTQCFSRNHDLKRHKRIHMAAKPFPCPTCNKSFSRRDALKRHRLVKACYKKADSKEGEAGPSRGSESPDGEPEYTTADWKPPGAEVEKAGTKRDGKGKEDREDAADKTDDAEQEVEADKPNSPPREEEMKDAEPGP